MLNDDDSNGCTPCTSDPVVDEFSLLCVSETLKIISTTNMILKLVINWYNTICCEISITIGLCTHIINKVYGLNA